MTEQTEVVQARRADAARNRDAILVVARDAFAESGARVSMAEISRRAGVGMATLYRNFPGRRDLLEALYVDEVDVIVDAAATVAESTPGATFIAWLRRFLDFIQGKHAIAAELLADDGDARPFMDSHRDRVLAAGRPLLSAAQKSREITDELTLEQVLDLIVAVAGISSDASYVEPMMRATLDGLHPPTRR